VYIYLYVSIYRYQFYWNVQNCVARRWRHVKMPRIRLNWLLSTIPSRPWIIGRLKNLYGINNSNGRLSEFWRAVPNIIARLYYIILCTGHRYVVAVVAPSRDALHIIIVVIPWSKKRLNSIVVHSPVIPSYYYEWTYYRRCF